MTKRWRKVVGWLFVVLGGIHCVHAAEEQCWFAHAYLNGTEYRASSFAAAAQAYATARATGQNGGMRTYTAGGVSCSGASSPGAGQVAICTYTEYWQCPTCSEHNRNGSEGAGVEVTSFSEDCPPDPCDSKSGKVASVGLDAVDDLYLNNACNNGCKVQRSGQMMTLRPKAGGGVSSTMLAAVIFTGKSCTDEVPVEEGDCISGSGGRMCIEQQQQQAGKNCGTFNGEMMCVDEMPANSCKAGANGGLACVVEGQGAVAPEKLPDNGTQGVPANPDAVIQNNGQTINYYGPSTVNNSHTSIVTNNTPKAGTSSGGSGSGDGSGCEGGIDACVEGATLGAVDGAGEAVQAMFAQLKEAPIYAAVANIGTGIPGGTCPAPSFEAFGQTLSLEGMCEIFESVATVISAVMLFAFAVMGARIVMSA